MQFDRPQGILIALGNENRKKRNYPRTYGWEGISLPATLLILLPIPSPGGKVAERSEVGRGTARTDGFAQVCPLCAMRQIFARIPLPPLAGHPLPGRGYEGVLMERNPELTKLAQTLRKNQTKEEALLWYNFLSKCPVRFHRQYVIGNYIVDFYCHKAKLVIELDGSQHYDRENMEADRARDAYLRQQGLTVLRIPNNAVTQNFSGVCEEIFQRIQSAEG